MPLGTPIPPSPAASQALLAAFAERGISWHPERLVRSLDPQRRAAVLADGEEMPFDLFLGEVTFLSGQRPNGQFDEPSDLLLADKAEFGTSRIRRWFDRDWTSY
jgi:hypothetical protein